MKRRKFLNNTIKAAGILFLPPLGKILGAPEATATIVTVTGKISADLLGSTLVHEHVLVDFIGADKVKPERYNVDEVFQKCLPYLKEARDFGCKTLVECTPSYLGRDVKLLQRLSEASGLQIITNTGYYGAVQGKYLPAHAFVEDAMQIADRWIGEWKNGIESSGIFPGFIKTGVDKGPLNNLNKKILEAAALTHLETGLTISAHTGDGTAALEEIEVLKTKGVSPDAFRWVHAQNEKNMKLHNEVGAMGAWVEFDGISPENINEHVAFIKSMKNNGLLDKVLLSHDAGWYHVGEPEGGVFRPYTSLYDLLIPALLKEGFKENELNLLLIENPKQSFQIRVRKI